MPSDRTPQAPPHDWDRVEEITWRVFRGGVIFVPTLLVLLLAWGLAFSGRGLSAGFVVAAACSLAIAWRGSRWRAPARPASKGRRASHRRRLVPPRPVALLAAAVVAAYVLFVVIQGGGL